MNRDIIVIPMSNGQKTVIATDCTGACGQKALDVVSVSTELLAYYTARVAFMEVLSVRATPVAYTVSNFFKDGYEDIHLGIGKLLCELNISELKNITSTETNFDMIQSAVGISVFGTMQSDIDDNADGLCFACIGSPLVGNEVVLNPDRILQMNTFLNLIIDDKAKKLLPVGSKGIVYKLKKVFGVDAIAADVDLLKSAGPSTCLLIGYHSKDEAYFANKLKDQFHPIKTQRSAL